MAKKKKRDIAFPENPRLDPEERIASKFDPAAIAKFPVASPEKMGYRVLDDCAEEHQM